MANFVIEFPLRTEIYQEDILNKRFEIGRNIYNALIKVTQKRYKEMIKTKQYRHLMSSLSDDKNLNKILWKQINCIRKEYGMSEYAFHRDVKAMQHHFKDNIDAHTAQKIASALWKSYEKFFYGNGKQVHFKKYGELNSLEGKSNKSGIRIINDMLVWKGLKIPIDIDYDNDYETQAMEHDICYSRIVRRAHKCKYKFYVQIVFNGQPPIKYNQSTGEVRHPSGTGKVGLDIGPSTIAIVSHQDVKLLELADRVHDIEKQKQLLLRKMHRSRRATNIDNYNKVGTIKKSKKWVRSNHYNKALARLKELYNKQARIRKEQHEILANYIISLGDEIYVETMNFAGLAKKGKLETNADGRYKRRKRFGKSIGNRAPAMLIDIINRKLSYYNCSINKINTIKARASQFNHIDGTYIKKSLSQRWAKVGNKDIQRDIYSAFLIMNINNDLSTFNIETCNAEFEHFCKLHDIEIERLKHCYNLKSIGI